MHNVTVAFAVLLVMLLSYFFGCFNGSFMVSHFIIRDDVRKHGSGNAGLTNFYRTYGAKYALLVIACDMGKTVAACLLGSFFFRCLGWDGTLVRFWRASAVNWATSSRCSTVSEAARASSPAARWCCC